MSSLPGQTGFSDLVASLSADDATAQALTTLTSTFTTTLDDPSTTEAIVTLIPITDSAEYASLTAVAAATSLSLVTGSPAAVLSSFAASGGSSIAATTRTYPTSSTASASTTSATASTSTTNNSSSPASSGLSLGAKVGTGVAVPIIVITAVLVAMYYFRCRRRLQGNPEAGASWVPEGKPELCVAPVDTSIAGSVRKKPELPTGSVTPLPPELHDTGIAEADPNAWKPSITPRKPLAAISTTSSQLGSDKPLIAINSHADSTLHNTTTHSTEAELIEEVDAAVQELGLLAMRKKALVTQANGLGKKPEEVEGRKGEEYRGLVVREEKVGKRLDDIEAERRS